MENCHLIIDIHGGILNDVSPNIKLRATKISTLITVSVTFSKGVLNFYSKCQETERVFNPIFGSVIT